MLQKLIDYYRCPASLAESVSSAISAADTCAPAFFPLAGSLVYGRLAAGDARPLAQLSSSQSEDILAQAEIRDGRCFLPFDPDEVLDNLRLERYQSALEARAYQTWYSRLSRLIQQSGYYTLRPLLPVAVRRHLQRWFMLHRRREPLPAWPLDASVERLMDRLLALAMQARGVERWPFIWFWPDGLPAAAAMTHDVETRAGRNYCAALMELDDSYGVKASFQLVPEKRYGVSVDHFRAIRSRGFEANIHDLNHDGRLFRRHRKFLRRATRINAYGRIFESAGYRSGGLYRNQEWYGAFEFAYDMSVPNCARYEAQPGGCCTLHPYFIGRVLELPVTMAEDYTLFQILRDYSLSIWEKQLDVVRARFGLASFIVHPDYIFEPRALAVYVALLARLAGLNRQRRIWLALPGEINAWWRQRHAMQLVESASGWRIEGEGSERARVAFARLSGNGIVYEWPDGSPVAAAVSASAVQSHC